MGANMDLGFLFVCSVIWGLWVSVEGKEEDAEEVDELNRAESATVLQKVKEERGTVNGTATIRMDNIRGMFSRTAEEVSHVPPPWTRQLHALRESLMLMPLCFVSLQDDVLDMKNELGEQDKGDEGDDADEPSTNM